jgi:hypothetical protein
MISAGASEPGGSGADGWAMKGKDKDLLVVYDRAKHLHGLFRVNFKLFQWSRKELLTCGESLHVQDPLFSEAGVLDCSGSSGGYEFSIVATAMNLERTFYIGACAEKVSLTCEHSEDGIGCSFNSLVAVNVSSRSSPPKELNAFGLLNYGSSLSDWIGDVLTARFSAYLDGADLANDVHHYVGVLTGSHGFFDDVAAKFWTVVLSWAALPAVEELGEVLRSH